MSDQEPDFTAPVRVVPEHLRWWDARHGWAGLSFACTGPDEYGQPVYVSELAVLEGDKVPIGTHSRVAIAHQLLSMAWDLLRILPNEVMINGTRVFMPEVGNNTLETEEPE